jgi:hypothetical protein
MLSRTIRPCERDALVLEDVETRCILHDVAIYTRGDDMIGIYDTSKDSPALPNGHGC